MEKYRIIEEINGLDKHTFIPQYKLNWYNSWKYFESKAGYFTTFKNGIEILVFESFEKCKEWLDDRYKVDKIIKNRKDKEKLEKTIKKRIKYDYYT